jgi:hypothetical protein
MPQELVNKIGYYSIFKKTTKSNIIYLVDSGKTLYISRLRKYIINPYRDVKEFSTYSSAKKYVENKLKIKSNDKKKKIESLPKSLYLILLKEESSNVTFVKVGITSKRFLMRRFSKKYGYDGYSIESILRRIDTPDAENLEQEIKNKLNKKRSVKKYRPLLENFSGYSECYNLLFLDDILKIFDTCVNKS